METLATLFHPPKLTNTEHFFTNQLIIAYSIPNSSNITTIHDFPQHEFIILLLNNKRNELFDFGSLRHSKIHTFTRGQNENNQE